MTRCCLCRATTRLQPVPPDSALAHAGATHWCTDRDACADRVRAIVAAHVGLGEVCSERHSDETNNTGVSHSVGSDPKVAQRDDGTAKRGCSA